jgi:polyisoprenoid-binding protein YceI
MANWKLDSAHSRANFSARHMMVTTVRGGFDKVSGVLEFDPENPENSYVDAEIEAASLFSGSADRDNHLRSADFLDVVNYPTITFKSTHVKVTDEDSADVTGDLTIRGVTRPVTLKVNFLGLTKDPWGGERAGFEATTKINREDWGLTWNMALETGGLLVSKDLKLEIDAQVILVPEVVNA